MGQRSADTGREGAETLALQALSFLLADDQRAQAFLTATGASASDLAAQAAEPAFLGHVLDALLADEALLIAFCDTVGCRYEAPGRARALLPGGADPHWT